MNYDHPSVKYNQPVLNVESPKSGILTNKNQIIVTGTVRNGYGTKLININNASSPISNESFSVNVSLEKEGENTVDIYVKDDISQSNNVTLKIIRDTTPPKIESSDNIIKVGDSIVIIEQLGKSSQEMKMSDQSGLARVLVNNRSLKIDDDKVNIPYNFLAEGKKNVVKIQDLAGNEIEMPVRFNTSVDSILEEAIKLYEEKKYKEALTLLDNYNKRRPGLPTTSLYRGMIYYELKDYQKAIDYLEDAYAKRELYDERGPNIEYNLFYWGASLYHMLTDQMTKSGSTNKEQRAKQDIIISNLLNKTIAKIDQFLYYTRAKKMTPKLYDAANNIKSDLAKISKSISISSQK